MSTFNEYTQGPTERSGTSYRTIVTAPDGSRYEIHVWAPSWAAGRWVGTVVARDASGDPITAYQHDDMTGTYACVPSVHMPGSYLEHSACYDAGLALIPVARRVADAVREAVRS